MDVSLVWVTPEAEKLIAYIARVSSTEQDKVKYKGLLRYLIAHGHWSPFEMAAMCVGITTSRAVSAQIIRHRSFSFQEFSQRYAEALEFEPFEIRKQDPKNRQSSIPITDPLEAFWLGSPVTRLLENFEGEYRNLLNAGVAKEVARMLLPLCTQTKLYMSGSVRSWIHYLQMRTKNDTQKEHRDVAEAIKGIFCEQFPTIGALAFTEQENDT